MSVRSLAGPRRLGLAAIAIAAVVLTAACGEGQVSGGTAGSADSDSATPTLNVTSQQNRITAEPVPAIAELVPQEIRDRGVLRVGTGSGAGAPPFSFTAEDDNTTWIGDEVDIAHLIGNVLDLDVETVPSSWEGLFLGIDSGSTDVGISNITVTEARKDLYDFATYRRDNLAVEVPEAADWTWDSYEDFSGRNVAVGSGTNQEGILVQFSDDLVAAGKDPINIKYYQDQTAVYGALSSGQIDAYFSPNPISAFHSLQVAGTPAATKIIGQYSGAGGDLQGLIGATVLKGNPLLEPLNEAINSLISTGEFEQVLERWNLQDEAVEKSEINPPGLPRDNS